METAIRVAGAEGIPRLPRPGQRVRWTEAGRWYSGRFVREVTADLVIKGHHLGASPAAALWLVRTSAGALAAHPPTAVDLVDDATDTQQGELNV